MIHALEPDVTIHRLRDLEWNRKESEPFSSRKLLDFMHIVHSKYKWWELELSASWGRIHCRIPKLKDRSSSNDLRFHSSDNIQEPGEQSEVNGYSDHLLRSPLERVSLNDNGNRLEQDEALGWSQ